MTSPDKSAVGADAENLGIETATWTASVAIIEETCTLTEQTLLESASHGTKLFPLVEEALTATSLRPSDLDLIAVSIGPGSFTGLRIGLSMAKGLALGRGIPVVGVQTLEALAAVVGPKPHRVWTVLDARKREVYAAAFEYTSSGQVIAAVSATVCSAATLAPHLEPPCTVVGNGVDAYADIFRARWGDEITLEPSANITPSGAAVARLGLERFLKHGADDLSELEPSYVRSSDAERWRIASI